MLLIIKGSHRDSFVLCHTNGDDANEHYCSLPVRRTALRLRNYNGTKDAKSNGECGRKFQLCVAPFDASNRIFVGYSQIAINLMFACMSAYQDDK